MTDLCYNCGDCHLPRPCPLDLKYCEICKNLGHAYNFCPLSVRQLEPNYQFWSLCHSCDAWHLPEPCKFPLHKCTQCGNGGHREYFCPVNPLSRQAYHENRNGQADAKTGSKRQRTDTSDIGREGGHAVHPDPHRAEYIRLIKTETTHEVLHLRDQGFSSDDILRFVTGAPLRTSHGTTTIGASQPIVSYGATIGAVAPSISVNTSQPPPQPVTPSSTGVYESQHQRFSSGELAQTVSSTYQSPYESVPSAPLVATTPVTRKKSARSNAACDDCKGSKKRCNHKEAPVMAPPEGYKLANEIPVTIPGYDTRMQVPGHQSSQEWAQSLASALGAAALPGALTEHPVEATLTAPYESMPNINKGSLSHLLNTTQDDAPYQTAQSEMAGKKYFTYHGLGNESKLNADTGAKKGLTNLLEHPRVGGKSSIPVHQAEPVAAGAELKDYVVVPNMTEVTSSDELPSTHEAPQSEETAQDIPKTAEKPKKARGRPKRKN